MVLPESSRHGFSPLEKVGQSRVLMTIFGRVLCPLQPSCLLPRMLPGHCCLVSSLDPISSIFLHQHKTLLIPLSLSAQPRPYHSFPLLSLSLLSCYRSVLSSLPKPSSSVHPPSPCFTPLCRFLCSFPSLLPVFSLSLLSFPSRKLLRPGLLCWLCTGSRVCWPLACSGTFLAPNQPCCTMHAG